MAGAGPGSDVTIMLEDRNVFYSPRGVKVAASVQVFSSINYTGTKTTTKRDLHCTSNGMHN